MNLSQYFDDKEGIGILSTVDACGLVNSAVYAVPHVIDDETIAFIMRPRRSLDNIRQNPNAAYLFIEKGPGYQGKRLILVKTHEETDPDKVNLLRRSHHGGDETQASLVYFEVSEVRPLVGDAEET